MAIPLMLSFLLEQLIGMTDVAFLGRVGEVELGAAALAGVFFLVLLMLGFGYSFGLQSYMGRRNGEKRHADIGRAFRAGSVFLVGLASLLIVLSFTLSEHFFSLHSESEQKPRGIRPFKPLGLFSDARDMGNRLLKASKTFTEDTIPPFPLKCGH